MTTAFWAEKEKWQAVCHVIIYQSIVEINL